MIAPLDLAAWETFEAAHPAPTFFASPRWAKALAAASSALAPAALLVERDDERLVVPLVRSTGSKLRFREYLGFPLGAYTCVLDDCGRVVSASRAARAIDAIRAHVDRLDVALWPMQACDPIDGEKRVGRETAIIDCRNGLERAISGVRGVTRRMAGQAARRGVTCERGVARDAGVYYTLLEDASRHWGIARPTISRALIDAVLEAGGDDAQLWFARVQGEPIAGALILFGSEELFFWSAAMRRDFSEYRPSNALNFALIEAACERGVSWYNLGASEGLAGVARFKSDLGARTVAYYETSFRRPAFRVYETLRSRWLARGHSE